KPAIENLLCCKRHIWMVFSARPSHPNREFSVRQDARWPQMRHRVHPLAETEISGETAVCDAQHGSPSLHCLPRCVRPKPPTRKPFNTSHNSPTAADTLQPGISRDWAPDLRL